MPQRVILNVIDTQPGVFSAHWEQLAARSLQGVLSVDSATRSTLFQPDWLHAIASARLSKITIGNEWLAAAPARYRCLAVGEDGANWKIMPASAHTRVERQFKDAGLSTDQPIALRRIAAAAVLTENEPWDFLALCLPIPPEAVAAENAARDLAAFLARQPGDAATIAVLLAGPESRWLRQIRGSAEATGAAHPLQDLIATALALLNVAAPPTFSGVRVDAQTPTAGENPYSADDEREIQKRLEDLGYL